MTTLFCINIWSSNDPEQHANETDAYNEVLDEMMGQGYGRSYEFTIRVTREAGETKATVVDWRQECATAIVNERAHNRMLANWGRGWPF